MIGEGDFQIRWMVRRDLPYILSIECDSFENPWNEKEMIGVLQEPHSSGVVAEFDEQVVGFVIYRLEKKAIHLLNLAVRSDCRRRGVGSALVNRLILKKLAPHGRALLYLEVSERNLGAQLFWRSLGFRAQGVEHGFYANGEDAYRMVYQLPTAGQVIIDRILRGDVRVLNPKEIRKCVV